MKCPSCHKNLKGIPPLSKEEWICINEDCPLNEHELYGATQQEVNESAKVFLGEEASP